MEIKEKDKMVEMNKFDFAVHPGVILKKYLRNIKMSQVEFAKRIGVNKTIINEIIKGKRNITMNLAIKFEPVFEVSPKFWCGLQSEYNEAILRLRNRDSVNYSVIGDSKVKQESFKKIVLETKQEIYCYAV